MIGASKILTVSYGTFSCTLEGFDEPFNTMKAIAEYFRDLAADDRYFGAEPPTPDAAMLHKIAEREVQRRVEAKIGENGVHLRAQEPMVAELAAPIPATPVMEAVPEPAALPRLIAMPEGVAARLAKIRASVAQGDAVIVPAVVLAEPEYTEDQHADELIEDELIEDMADFAMFDDAEIAPMDMPSDLATPETQDSATAETLMAAVEEPVALAPDLSDDDMLADLAALDAPVATQDESDAAIESLEAVDAAEDAGFDMADLDLGTDQPTQTEPAVETPDDFDLSSRLGALIDPDDVVQDVANEPASEWSDAADDAMLDALDMADDTPIAIEQDTVEAELTTIDAADDTLSADMVAEPEPVTATVDEPVDEPVDESGAQQPEQTVAAPDLSDKIQRARARVIRIRRNPEIAVAPAAIEPQVPETVATPARALSVDAEAELERELAALESESPALVADEDDAELRRQLAMIEDDANAIAVEPVAEPTETAAHAAMADAVQDAAVSRLMQQTQSEMAVPENRRRLSAIAHLKAAVAATVAERFGTKAKTEDVDATRTEPYRDDLARVVRPRRPESSATAPVRPAPLVLVSEQRIDRPVAPATVTPGHITPVRPRRVSSAALAPQLVEDFDDDEDDEDDNIFTDARGFAEFADRLGAHSLPDMLEAAAAYAATVEGRPSFSRPQLMRQVNMATGETDASREDGLRSFGALLRDGRIIKVRRGQFALTDQSRFLQDAKKIAD